MKTKPSYKETFINVFLSIGIISIMMSKNYKFILSLVMLFLVIISINKYLSSIWFFYQRIKYYEKRSF